MKKPLIVLTGPTAAGKTHLSIALAKAVNGEIISADSMQVYKYMDIGSAKIRPEEMQGVKHYLVDELLPEEEFPPLFPLWLVCFTAIRPSASAFAASASLIVVPLNASK